MTPSVGRIVHVMMQGEICAAIVCYVHSSTTINVAWFTSSGEPKSLYSVEYAERPAEGRWWWPPRV